MSMNQLHKITKRQELENVLESHMDELFDPVEHSSLEEAMFDWSEEPEEFQLFLQRNGYSVKQRIIRALSTGLAHRVLEDS